jgi:hypothetical protein
MLTYPVQAERWHLGGAAVDGERLSTTEAAGKLVWWLAHGEALSNHDAMLVTGLPYETTRKMLERLCRVLPLTFDDGVWYIIELAEIR